jgi:hypothetical protein
VYKVIFRGTYWARTWAKLSREEDGIELKKMCSLMEITVMEIFNKFGWTSRNRIQA